MFRILTSLPPGMVRFTIVDPIGIGRNFGAFMHLADYDPALVTNQVWTDPRQIEERLAELEVAHGDGDAEIPAERVPHASRPITPWPARWPSLIACWSSPTFPPSSMRSPPPGWRPSPPAACLAAC